ncbi:MAG: Smr/MutS family protein [Granulosicoccus sp.]|nr:Smr/MutS family protein [Granulosicoccus sp.]
MRSKNKTRGEKSRSDSAEKPSVTDEDRSLFRDAVGAVKPVSDDRHRNEKRKPPAEPISQHRDDASVMRELLADFSETDLLETGEHSSYTADGVQRSVLRNLKSGKYAIQAELDLHGFSLEQSHHEFNGFLKRALERQYTCIRIIHGKGRKQSDKAPVLKPAVASWLRRNRQVLAFCSARDADGGTGAVYVLLRKRKPGPDDINAD